jgi:hypothetical protein
MKKIKQIKILLILGLLVMTSTLITSCYPDYGLTTSDYDIVATFKEDANDFQSYKTNGATFYISETIKRLTDNVGGSEDDPGPYDQQILDEIEKQMIAYGYTKVDSIQQPDVFISVGITKSENVVYYPGYWYGWYGWYYPWYGGYAYSYTTGSLFVTMIDRNKIDEANKVTGAVWAGIANGVLDDTNANILTRVINSVDKMFEQSPYLKIIE